MATAATRLMPIPLRQDDDHSDERHLFDGQLQQPGSHEHDKAREGEEVMTPNRKKLIEAALPLKAINDESSLRKRKAPAGYPTTLHKWWAQRPLAA